MAGAFENAANIAAADYLARWNGTSWSAVGTDGSGKAVFNDSVRALAVSGNTLYAVGDFTNAAGIPEADYVAKWNGNAWSALGGANGDGAIPTTLNTQAIAVAVDGQDVYVGGAFENVSAIPDADYLARWNGTAWTAVGSDGKGGPALTGGVYELLVSGAGVYVGGNFDDAFGDATADNIALWNRSSWQSLAANGQTDGELSDWVMALTMIGSDLYAGGNFLNLYGGKTNYIRRWDGSDWQAVGAVDNWDLNGPVHDLAVLDGKLVAGGNFNLSADYVGILDGTTWSTLGPDGALDYRVMALLVTDGDVYAGGAFTDAAGIATADRVAKLEIASAHKPDARIRKGSGSLRGNNIYNDDGKNQTISAGRRRGESLTFKVNVQNDGTVKERFIVRATGASTTMYTVRYFRGTTEITSSVVAGTYLTPMLAPGEAVGIRAIVKVKSTATIGSAVARLVRVTTNAGALDVDAVKFVVQRT